MATGRTLSRFMRVYGGGYDLSGDVRTIGALPWSYDAPDITTITDGSKNHLLGMPTIGGFGFVGIMNSTATTGLHTLTSAGTTNWDIMVPVGIRAAPAQGDPVWMGKFPQKSYKPSDDTGAVIAALEFGTWDGGDLAAYNNPWGTLLHANSAVTAVNSAVGVDGGAASALGGYMMVQVFAGNGTATIKVQHASTNADGSFGDLGGCTTGVVSMETPFAGIYNTTALTTSVSQYTRWQIVLGTASSVTFALAFARGR